MMMSKLRLIFSLALFLISLLLQSTPVQAAYNLPQSPVLFPAQQQNEESKEQTAQLGENRGDVPEGGSDIWTVEGQTGDVLTIKAEADKPANDASTLERSQAGLWDMILIVYTPDGTIIAKADDIQPGIVTDAVIEGLALPTDGTYKIEVLGLQKEGSGAYTLTLQGDSVTSPEPTPTIDPYLPTLTIENKLEEIICYVYIWSTSTDELGDEWLGTKEVILPNSSHQWPVAPDSYNIAVSDCYGNTLDVREQFDVTEPSTLTVSPSAIDGPEAQCAEGKRLFFEGKPADALSLLEAGFAARESAIFADPDDEGRCALRLGLLRDRTGNRSGALVAYQVALDIFQSSGNRQLEGMTLNKMGTVYHDQGKYTLALEQYQKALEIYQEVGNRLREGATLHNIGEVYDAQERYPEALDYYQQSLEIDQEVGDRAGEGNILNNIAGVYRVQGEFLKVLEYYQQVLEINREVRDGIGEGSTLNNIGEVYDIQGKYLEALQYYRQALVITREVGDRAEEGITLYNIAKVYRTQRKYKEALEIYQQKLEIEREVGNRASEGATLNNIGLVYDQLESYPKALEYYQQALDISREVGNRDDSGTTLYNIGLVYDKQGSYLEALESYQQALEISREVGDRALEGATFNGIAEVYRVLGRYLEALEFYQQELELSREVSDRASEGATLNNIGLVYSVQGRYREALEYYQQALEIRRKVLHRVGEGVTLHNIAAVYENQGRYGKALEYYQQALDIRREAGDRAGYGDTLNNIGLVYRLLGRHGKALEYFWRALENYQGIGNRMGEGATLHNIAGVYRAQKKHGKALTFYRKALDIWQEVGDRASEGVTLNSYAMVYDNQGRHEEALGYLEQALEILQEVGDGVGEGTALSNIAMVYRMQSEFPKALEYYQRALDLKREAGYRLGEGITLHAIGLTYQQQGQSEKALHNYEQAMDVFEGLRATAGRDEERSSFIAQYANLYHHAINLYHQQGQDELAYQTSERGRARSFLDSLVTGEVQLSDDELQGLLAREREFYAQRFDLRIKLAENPPDTELVAQLEARLKVAEEAYSEVLADIEARGGQLEELIPGRSTVLKLSEVQALLDEQTTLVSYWLLGDEGTLAFIITQDSFSVVELPLATTENLTSRLTALYGWPNLDNPSPDTLKELHEWLIAPLQEHLRTQQIGIIPHQLLHYVPFAALTDGDGYFGEQHTLFVLPSASALQRIQETVAETAQAQKQPALVFGNPTTSQELELSPLYGAADEARAVAELLGVPAYLGDEASEERLWSAANNAQVLHLSAHGVYVTTNPFYNSAVFLAPSDDGKGHSDGRLEVAEVYGLDLTATEMVVLSACETSINDLSARDEVAVSASDEVVGLTRAFLFAGTPTVVASLWPVDDSSTKELMVSFYRHWQEEGMSKGEALAAAQTEIREKYPSPYYWAGFVLSGEPGEVTSPEPIPSPTETASSSPYAPEVPNKKELEITWPLVVGTVGFLGVVVLVVASLGLRRRLRGVSGST